jgi:hypothetical protein
MNNDMIEDYDSARVTASSYLDRKHRNAPCHCRGRLCAQWMSAGSQSLALIEAIG